MPIGSIHAARGRISLAKAQAANGRKHAQATAANSDSTIDRLMLGLAVTMVANAERQLTAAWEIIGDVADTPATPDRKETSP